VKLLKDINEKVIQKNTDAGSYKMGRDYYLSNKVRQYKVKTSFNSMTPFTSYECECNTHFSFYNHRSMCEHVVATLLKYIYEKSKLL
jgi:hypothetical protein